jgi:hypothetical protein
VVKQQLTGVVGLNSSILGRLYDDVYVALEFILISKLCHTKRQTNIEAQLLPRSSFLTSQDLIGLMYLRISSLMFLYQFTLSEIF